MKTPKAKSSSKKKRLCLIALMVVVAITSIAYFVMFNKPNQTKPDTTSSPSSEPTTNTGKNVEEAPSEGLPANTTEMTSDQVPISQNLTVSIASLTQSNGTVEASAQTNNGGTCVFIFKPADDGKPVTRQIAVSNEFCSTNISENEFTYIGNWSLTVTFYNNSQKAEAQKDVSIN